MLTVHRSVVLAAQFGPPTPLNLPLDSKIVHVGPLGTGDGVEFWYQCDSEEAKAWRKFLITGTGQPSPEADGTYVGCSGRCENGLVWHLWEV